jgi:methylmalonyl-CoA mutase
MTIKQRIEQFVRREGRRPRILISNMGKKSHEPDSRMLAAFFAETGFDVDISPRRQTPRGTARMAIENDVHVICFLSSEKMHKSQVAELSEMLKAQGAENIKIVIGGRISSSDHDILHTIGVDLILRPGPIDTITVNLLLDVFE